MFLAKRRAVVVLASWPCCGTMVFGLLPRKRAERRRLRTIVGAPARREVHVVQHTQVPMSSSDTVPPGREQGRAVILVIDDEEMILYMLRDVLEMAGYTVLLASNGQAGLARAQEAVPDLILTDVMMPVMDGHALCRQLRSEPRTAKIPVIGMSAAYKPQADDAFDALIAKPFDIPPLLAVIRTWLGGGL